MKNIISLFILLFAQLALADKPISFSGRVMDTSNNAIEDVSTLFNIKITNSASCVIYDENFTLDMTGTNGYFKVALSGGQVVFAPAGLDIFRSKGYLCKDGSSWSAGPNDLRKVTMTVKVGDQPAVTFASDTMNSVAYANETDYIKGKSITDLIQTSAFTTQTKVDQLTEKTQGILDLVNGTNNVYAKQSLVDSSLNAKQNALSYTPLNPNRNLDDISNAATARTNLGLGSLALRSSISDADIPSLSWSKISGFPSGSYATAAHQHAISDVTNLGSTLAGKVDTAAFTCTSTQVIKWSVATGFTCDEIHLSGDVAGTAASSVVTKIQGKSISTQAPNTGDSLVYNGTSWAPAAGGGSGGAGGTPKVFAGEIFMFPATCPTGSVLADGQSLDQSLYVELFQVYACTFTCPTAVTFKIPDYRGYFLRMADSSNPINVPQVDTMRGHAHPISDLGHSHGVSDPGHVHNPVGAAIGGAGAWAPGSVSGPEAVGHSTSKAFTGISINSASSNITIQNNTGVNVGTENRPKNVPVNYCIRLKNTY